VCFEIVLGLRPLGLGQFTHVFWLTVKTTLGVGARFVLSVLCPFAGNAKIDHLRHRVAFSKVAEYMDVFYF